MIDYHVHTLLCNHARGAMEAYVQAALDRGLAEICFLDHLTIGRQGRPLSMTVAEVPLYFQAVKRLAHRYRDAIQIKVGLEVDYSPDHLDLVKKVCATFAFDVIACSLHYLGDTDIVSRRSALKQGVADPLPIYQRYLEGLAQMLVAPFFDMICHLDLFKKFALGKVDAINGRFEVLFAQMAAHGVAIEINTSGLDHPAHQMYPSPELLGLAQRQGVALTLGSDAHRPETIGRHYPRAMELVRAAGYKNLTIFSLRRQSQVALPDDS